MITQAGLGREGAVVSLWPNTESNIDMAKLLIFNRKIEKVLDFLTACRLYIRIRIREVLVEE